MSGALRVKGRHARPATGVPCPEDAGDAASPPRDTRRVRVAAAVRRATATARRPGSRSVRIVVAGAACLTAVVTTSLALIPARHTHPSRTPSVNVLAARPAPAPEAVVPSRPSRTARRGDQTALAFYESHDRTRAAHVTRVVWTGPMLRVYTDLPASDADSRTAVALCETAVAYAQDRGRLPAVFVHAGRQAGYPVLANKMGTHDGCELGRVP